MTVAAGADRVDQIRAALGGRLGGPRAAETANKNNGRTGDAKFHGVLPVFELLPRRRCGRQVWNSRQEPDFPRPSVANVDRSPMAVDLGGTAFALVDEVVFTDRDEFV